MLINPLLDLPDNTPVAAVLPSMELNLFSENTNYLYKFGYKTLSNTEAAVYMVMWNKALRFKRPKLHSGTSREDSVQSCWTT